MTLVLTWLYEHTHSVLLCVLLHAAANTAAALGLPYAVAHPGNMVPPTVAGFLLLATGLLLSTAALPRPRRPAPAAEAAPG